MKAINPEERGKTFKELDLSSDVLPVERALGVHWCVENDSFGFRNELKDRPLTRRGILSTVSSVYDPLGLAAPFLLKGKIILQQLCADKKGWDEDIGEEHTSAWEKWRRVLPKLESIKVQRCFKQCIIFQTLRTLHMDKQATFALKMRGATSTAHCSLVKHVWHQSSQQPYHDWNSRQQQFQQQLLLC